jgi:hypothetical protein
MFYCDDCATKQGWHKTVRKSLGPCEICDELAACNDLPSALLTSEKKIPKDENDAG